jgi:hypothetical protein
MITLVNNDSMIVVIAVIVVGGLFTYTFYNIFTTIAGVPTYNEVAVQTESLVNIKPSIDSISELPESTYPVL